MIADHESRRDLIGYAASHGYEVTPAQLVRWHRAGLLPRPRQRPLGRGRGTETSYPSGTSAQLVALCQLKTYERRLGRVAFRLWWDGFPIDPKVIRSFLLAAVRPIDDQIREKSAADRDVMAASRRLHRGSRRLGAGAILAYSKWTDNPEPPPPILSWESQGTTPPTPDDVATLTGRALAARLRGSAAASLISEAADDDLARARDRARSLLALMRSAAAPLAWLYGKSGSIFRMLDHMVADLEPADYAGVVASVLIFAPLVRPETMAAIDAGIEPPLAYQLRQILAIRDQVDGAADVLTPMAIRALLRDREAARHYRPGIESFVTTHEQEVEAAVASIEPWNSGRTD